MYVSDDYTDIDGNYFTNGYNYFWYSSSISIFYNDFIRQYYTWYVELKNLRLIPKGKIS